jgi:tol-pal system protein YbgF
MGAIMTVRDSKWIVCRWLAVAAIAVLAGLPAGNLALAQDANAIAAAQEIRIQQLENEIRSLTGMVENLTYQVQQLSGRFDKLVADSDYRLRSLEGGAAAPAVAGVAPQPTTTAPAQAQPAATAALPPPPSDQPALLGETTVVTGGVDQETGAGQVGQPKTLGTLTQNQYEQQSAILGAPTSMTEGDMAPANNQTYATTQPYQLPGANPDEQYQYAFGLLRQAKYADAEQALRTFIQLNPDHPLAGNANYWLGETYYVRSDFNQAALIFANGYQTYPKSGKAPDTLLKLGMSLAAMGQASDACVAFGELEVRYPGASDTVKQRLATERSKNGC